MTPKVYTIPPHRAFADALATGLLALHGKEKTGLARGVILVPNQRAARAIQDAFVRRAGGGLLMPRLVPIGDPDLDERLNGALDPLDTDSPIPPAVDPVHRLMLLAHLVQQRLGELYETKLEAWEKAGDVYRAVVAYNAIRGTSRTGRGPI